MQKTIYVKVYLLKKSKICQVNQTGYCARVFELCVNCHIFVYVYKSCNCKIYSASNHISMLYRITIFENILYTGLQFLYGLSK